MALCECNKAHCTFTLPYTLYVELVRKHPGDVFIVVPRHIEADDVVIEETPEYAVVRSGS